MRGACIREWGVWELPRALAWNLADPVSKPWAGYARRPSGRALCAPAMMMTDAGRGVPRPSNTETPGNAFLRGAKQRNCTCTPPYHMGGRGVLHAPGPYHNRICPCGGEGGSCNRLGACTQPLSAAGPSFGQPPVPAWVLPMGQGSEQLQSGVAPQPAPGRLQSSALGCRTGKHVAEERGN